jgi:hypothetical protein
MFSKIVKVQNKRYLVRAPSTTKHKKYDVYEVDGKKLLAFGDDRYSHYFDRLGYYKTLDTLDKERRRLYKIRHAKDRGLVENNPNYPSYWSFNFLWK